MVLAGDRVVNKGTINTPGGSTVLAAGDQATVALSNGQLVNVTLNASVANATVKNSGVIKAEGGKVVLSANGAGTVIGGAVNLTGTIDVSSALAGAITVDAGPGGTVNATNATLKAVSTAGKGGNITLAGNQVGLFSGTKVNASGTTGGGTVLVGGGAHGSDASVRNASVTVLDSTSSIDASATNKGDGGTVVLWSSTYTGFYGTVTVLGGPNGGSGGWVETSSQSNLQAWGSVQAGPGGSWLLDPSNVNIAASANAGESFNTTNGTWTPSLANATINVAAIDAQLGNGTSVTVTTASGNASVGNITINANIAKTGGGNATLTLIANGAIVDNGFNISSTTGKLNVNMTANGTVTLANGSAFALNGGNLSIQGGNATNANVGVNIGQTTMNAAAATLVGTTTSTFAVNTFGALNASATTLLTINGSGGTNASVNFGSTVNANAVTVTGIASANGTGIVVGANLTAAGCVTLNGTGNGTGSGSGVNIAAALTSNTGTVKINGSGNGSFGVAVTGSVTTLAGDILIVGSSNGGVGANMAGALNAAGNLTVNGTSQSQRGTRLAGTIVATGTVNITGSSNSGDGIAVPANLALTAANALLTGTANTSHGINISGTLNAAGTNLTLNGTSTASDGSYYGVNVSGTVNVGSLTTNGIGNLNATGDVGGTSVAGTVNATSNVTLNGQSNGTFSGVFFTGNIAANGNVTLNGTGNNKYGVNATGTLNAGGTVTINGTSNGTTGVLLSGALTLAAHAGATIVALSNAANGLNFNGTMDSTATPLLTINGTSMAPDNSSYGVAFNGTANVASLVLNGIGNLTATSNVGGTTFGGTLNATGNVTVNGQSNGIFAGVYFTGCIAAGGNVMLNGSGVAKYGVNASGTVNATGTVTINGTAAQTAGVLLNTSLNIAANAGATIIALSNSTNGFFFAGVLNANGTPLLTINGTTANTGGSYYGVAFTGNATVANLAINGVGNLTATNAVGGTTFNGSATASGNVTVNGQSNGSLPAVYFSGGIVACGSIVLNGTAKRGIGVNASGTLNAGSPVTLTGGSNSNIGVLVASDLTLVGSQNATVVGTTNTGVAGFSFANGNNLTAGGALTINGTNGVELDGSLNASSNLTVNANRITLNNGTFSGANSAVVLQALNSAATMLVNGSGAGFGNVASVLIGGTSQAAALNMSQRALDLCRRGQSQRRHGRGQHRAQRQHQCLGGQRLGRPVGRQRRVAQCQPVERQRHGWRRAGRLGHQPRGRRGRHGSDLFRQRQQCGLRTAGRQRRDPPDQGLCHVGRRGLGLHVVGAQSLLSRRADPHRRIRQCDRRQRQQDLRRRRRGAGLQSERADRWRQRERGQPDRQSRQQPGAQRRPGAACRQLHDQPGQRDLRRGQQLCRRQRRQRLDRHRTGEPHRDGDDWEQDLRRYERIAGARDGERQHRRRQLHQCQPRRDLQQHPCARDQQLDPERHGHAHQRELRQLDGRQPHRRLQYHLCHGERGLDHGREPDGDGDHRQQDLRRHDQLDGARDGQRHDRRRHVHQCQPGAELRQYPRAGRRQLDGQRHQRAYQCELHANSTAGSLITDYAVTYCTARATITAKTLTVTATTQTRTYDGTILSNATPTVNGAIAGDTFNISNLSQVFNNSHVLGANNSTLIANGTVSIANSTAGSLVSDYNLTFANATGTVTAAALTVTATTGTKTYDGTTTSTVLATVTGNMAGDTINNASLAEAYGSIHVLGANGSTLNVAAPLTNASLNSTTGSNIADYTIIYVTAAGTITPKALTVTANTDTKVFDGTAKSNATATVCKGNDRRRQLPRRRARRGLRQRRGGGHQQLDPAARGAALQRELRIEHGGKLHHRLQHHLHRGARHHRADQRRCAGGAGADRSGRWPLERRCAEPRQLAEQRRPAAEFAVGSRAERQRAAPDVQQQQRTAVDPGVVGCVQLEFQRHHQSAGQCATQRQSMSRAMCNDPPPKTGRLIELSLAQISSLVIFRTVCGCGDSLA